MFEFVLKRLTQSIIVMIAVGFVAFSMFNFVGDPIANLLGPEVSAQDRERLRSELGLDQPTILRFARFVGDAARGQFGVSYRSAQPVAPLILSRFPATFELAAAGMGLALLIGLPLGVFTGIHRHHWLSRLILGASLIGVSLPIFVTGIILIVAFSVTLGWLPSFGRGEVVQIGWWSTGFLTASGLKSLILPAITLGLFQLTLILRLVRSEMLETLRADYIKFARARGLSKRSVYFGHALRNALMPVVTIVGLHFGSMIAFAIITESVFQWPGMGLLFLDAIQFADVPVMATYLIFVSLVFVAINLVVDLLYVVIDPRLRASVAS